MLHTIKTHDDKGLCIGWLPPTGGPRAAYSPGAKQALRARAVGLCALNVATLARDCLRVPGKQRLVSGGADGLLKVLEVASHAQ